VYRKKVTLTVSQIHCAIFKLNSVSMPVHGPSSHVEFESSECRLGDMWISSHEDVESLMIWFSSQVDLE